MFLDLVPSSSGGGGLEVLGWQATRHGLRQRMSYLLMNEEMADVFFLFANADGTTQVNGRNFLKKFSYFFKIQ